MIINLYGTTDLTMASDEYVNNLLAEEALAELTRYSEGLTNMYSEAFGGFVALLKLGFKFLLSFITSFQGIIIAIVSSIIAILVKRKLRKTLEANYGGSGGGSVSVSSSYEESSKAGTDAKDININNEAKGIIRDMDKVLSVDPKNITPEAMEECAVLFDKIFGDGDELFNAMYNALHENVSKEGVTFRTGVIDKDPASFFVSSREVLVQTVAMLSTSCTELLNRKLCTKNDQYPNLAIVPKNFTAFANDVCQILDVKPDENTLIEFMVDNIANISEYFMLAVLSVMIAPLSAVKDEETLDSLLTGIKDTVNASNNIKFKDFVKENISQLNPSTLFTNEIGESEKRITRLFNGMLSSTSFKYKLCNFDEIHKMSNVLNKYMSGSTSVFANVNTNDLLIGTKIIGNNVAHTYTYPKWLSDAEGESGKNLACQIVNVASESGCLEREKLNKYRDSSNRLKSYIKNVQNEINDSKDFNESGRQFANLTLSVARDIQTIIGHSINFLNSAWRISEDPIAVDTVNSTLAILSNVNQIKDSIQ